MGMFRKLFGTRGEIRNIDAGNRREPTFERYAPAAGASPVRADTRPGDLTVEAARLLKPLLMRGHQDARGIHIETLLSTVAALCGHKALQAALAMIEANTADAREFPQFAKLRSPAGDDIILCELVNELLVQMVDERISTYGLVKSSAYKLGARNFPDMTELFKRNAAAIGTADYPPLTVPIQHRPHEHPVVALREWLPAIDKVFSLDDFATLHPMYHLLALGYVAGELIEVGKDVLDPEIAVVLIMETAVGISKIANIDTYRGRPPDRPAN